jgi:tRNA(fMet)-specific endonuclease VapC
VKCAEIFGQTRGQLLQPGIAVNTTDLMIASVALRHHLTLVTHNAADFQHFPNLKLDDWLKP